MGIFKDIEFIKTIEEMKKIYRMTKIIGEDRRENDAEHSWHVATMSLFLEKYSKTKIDVNKVIKMMLVHDLVEIYAGDTFAYDENANLDKSERELKAMDKIISQTSKSLGALINSLWLEFENKETDESKYANAMDRLQPLLANIYSNDGGTWKENNVRLDQVLKRMEPIKYFNDDVYKFVIEKVNEGVKNGYIIAS